MAQGFTSNSTKNTSIFQCSSNPFTHYNTGMDVTPEGEAAYKKIGNALEAYFAKVRPATDST